MDVVAIIGELRKELERIDGIIVALEALQHGKRRGRPPKALQALREGEVGADVPAVRRAAKAARKATKKKTAKKAKAAKKG
jgi:hypothetical protein